jgi:A/G-specific adenine glycosylase
MPPAAPAGFAAAVVAWQRTHGRHGLPWHGLADPYRVWLSEVMLQQTQVAVVLAYWPRFLDRFPDVAALAAAPLDDVLAAWSGLGYYSRARNLHRAAQAVVDEHGGRFPATAAALETLPGVGRSTAAAVAAFAFGERAAILDGNVKRVLARVLAFAGDLATARATATLWDHATALLPDAPADMPAYTQGLMDLGATVCLPRAPRCLVCPVEALCAARRSGTPERWPVRTRTVVRRALTTVWLELRHRERTWLVQRPPRGVWAGLWSLPEFASHAALDAATAGWPGAGERLPAFVHVLSHRDWTFEPVRWTLPARTPKAVLDAIAAAWPEGRWWHADEALALGLPAPLRRRLAEPQDDRSVGETP